jgi:hypothetical protein
MAGLYRKAGEDGADVYLKAWSEDPIRVSRVTSGDATITRPNLTLCLCVQPSVIARLAGREDFRGRGLIARFLCSYPRTKVGHRNWGATKPIPPTTLQSYNHAIRSLLAIPREPPALVRLGATAEGEFLAYRNEVESALRPGGALADWGDLGGKLAGHCARLSLILHMAEHGPSGVNAEVSETTMRAAVALARYFTRHTIATWESSATEPLGARVVRWLERERRETLSTRDLQRAFSRAFRRAQLAREMAAELADRGYLARRGPDQWAVNPLVYVAPSTRADTDDKAM